jgi:hypothetical protein
MLHMDHGEFLIFNNMSTLARGFEMSSSLVYEKLQSCVYGGCNNTYTISQRSVAARSFQSSRMLFDVVKNSTQPTLSLSVIAVGVGSLHVNPWQTASVEQHVKVC